MPKLNIQFATSQRPPRSAHAGKIAYIVSAFPALSETFVLHELIAMEGLGVPVELYPLRRLRAKVQHAEAEQWTRRAHYHPYFSLSILRAHWRFIRSGPVRYLKTWFEVLRGTWGSLNFFLGAIAIFPKAVLFAERMLEQKITHIHAHFANHPTVAALIIHRLTGIPFSFTARGTDIQVDQQMLKEKIEAAQFAISVSLHNKELMVRECGAALGRKIEVIHGGVDVERFRPQPRAVSGHGFRILCTGRFEEVKGHIHLVAACKLLRERKIPFECRLIGDGPLVSSIKSQIQCANLSDAVRLLGELPYPEVIRELQQADVVVLPTAPTANGKREGIPNALKEAMACGLPVIASRVGGIPELVTEQTGILVPPRDAAALVAAIEHLGKDRPLCQRLGRAGRQRVVRNFNLKVSAARRAALFVGPAIGLKLPHVAPPTKQTAERISPATQSV